MGLVYSGGTIQKVLVDGSAATNLVADMKTRLETSGWTASAISGGWNMTSGLTSQNFQFRVDIYVSGGVVYFNAQNVAGTVTAQGTVGNGATQIYTGGATPNYYLICHKFGFFLFLLGNSQTFSSGNPANGYYCGVPWLPEPVQPLVVTGATNATPIEITTSSAHDLNNGDYVYIDQVGGNTAANGFHQITVTSTTAFTLNAVAGSGAYTSGGYVGTTGRISRAFFSYANRGGNFFASDDFGWRTGPQVGSVTSAFIVINEAAYAGTAGDLRLEGAQQAYPWRESRLAITEPYVMGAITTGGTRQLQFQLFNAALINGTPQSALDALTTFDSKSWHCFGSDADVALYLAYA